MILQLKTTKLKKKRNPSQQHFDVECPASRYVRKPVSLSHGACDILLWWPESINSSLFFQEVLLHIWSKSCVHYWFFSWLQVSSNLFAFAHVQLCLTLCDPMKCSQAVSSVHGIFQARILEWVAIFSGDLPKPGIKPPMSPVSPALQADSLPTERSGKPIKQ